MSTPAEAPAQRGPHEVSLTYNVDIYRLMMMARKLLHSFYLDPAMSRNLKAASKAEEIPQSQIVRDAIRTWLETYGYQAKRPKRKGARMR